LSTNFDSVGTNCLLSTCFEKTNHPLLFSIIPFYWILLFIIYLFLSTLNWLLASVIANGWGLLTVIVFGNSNGITSDLLIVFGCSLVAAPIGYLIFKQKRSHDGILIAPVFALTSFICSFPLAWLYRVWFNESVISKNWHNVLLILSILSIVAIALLLVAIFSKSQQKNNASGVEIVKRKVYSEKNNQQKPINGFIVTIIYIGSFLVNSEYVRQSEPTALLYKVLFFWIIIYPLLKNRTKWIKSTVLILYLVFFQLGLDGLMYKAIQQFATNGEYKVLLTDYIIILIYLALFPVFKTYPQYKFMKRNTGKTFSEVFKENFNNEMIILLITIIKMNLLHYQI
jgi:hypothetical protein